MSVRLSPHQIAILSVCCSIAVSAEFKTFEASQLPEEIDSAGVDTNEAFQLPQKIDSVGSSAEADSTRVDTNLAIGTSGHEIQPSGSTETNPILEFWKTIDPIFKIVAFVVAILAIMTFFQRRKEKKEKILLRASRFFERVGDRVSKAELQNRETFKRHFYWGKMEISPITAALLNLDAERPMVKQVINRIKDSQKDYCHLNVYGHNKQGKTILLARIAVEISRSREFHTLWCKANEILDHEFLPTLTTYSSYFLKRKRVFFGKKPRLVLFIDNLSTDLTETDQEVVESKNFYTLLQGLSKLRLTIISTSLHPIDFLVSVLPWKLEFSKTEEGYFLQKLGTEALLTSEQILTFKRGEYYKLYKDKLFAFLSLLLAHAEGSELVETQHLKRFDRLIDNTLSLPQKQALLRPPC